MHRIDSDGAVASLYQEGNPSIGLEATETDADHMNAFQEELITPIETRAGITLVKNTNTQLAAAMDQLTILPGGRLTLESGVGVSTSDQAGKTTVYYTPHRHDRIALYNGTNWLWRTFTELSQATTDATKSPAAVAASKVYDVFVWLDGSTMRATRGPLWDSDTSRGTGAGKSELEFFEGRWVNKVAITNGPAARRGLYVGTIRSDASSQINDKLTARHVWNCYHRSPRPMLAVDTTNSWTYSTATFRQANAAAGNQIDYVAGLAEDAVSARVAVTSVNNNTAGARTTPGIGVDSTSVNSAQIFGGGGVGSAGSPGALGMAMYDGVPGIGRHTLVWLEWSTASGTTTWYGDDGSVGTQAGISGTVLA
jgi:hypothetical protein